MPTNTSGGTTTSFMNTPQAVDDYFGNVREDYIYCFDVMANDLGGNAKILWSIDDTNLDGTTGVSSSGDGTYDLLKQDAALCPEKSDKGARIWIEAGKIKYDATVFNYLAANQSITDTFTYAIRLSNGTLSWATVTITITGSNDGPVAVADTVTTSENASIVVNVLANDTDADNGAVLTVTAATAPAGQGTASIVGNQVQFNPGADFDDLAVGQSEVVVVSYTITDEHGATSSATVSITVTGTNDGPVANADTATTSENASLLVNVLANDTDVDNGSVLTVTGANAPIGQGTASVESNQVRFNPGTDFDDLAVGQSEVVVVSYTISDEQGATSNSTATITVTGTNDGPVANADSGTTTENASALIDVLGNDTDVDDGAVLTVTTASAPAGQGSASVVGNQVEFDPGADFDYLAVGESALVVVSYSIEDEHGASASSSIEVTVTGTNDGVSIVAGGTIASGAVVEDSAQTASLADSNVASGTVAFDDPDLSDVHAADFDPDPTNTTNLGTFALGPVTEAANTSGGAVGWTYTIDEAAAQSLAKDEVKTEKFVVTVTDPHGLTATQIVTVTITGTNDGPVANADTDTTSENVALLIDVLANDTDVDNGAVLTVTTASAPVGEGTASVVDNQVRFDPGAEFDHLNVGDTAEVEVSYTIEDEHGAMSSSTVTITVTGTNDGPVANADSDTTAENDVLLVDVLANDTDADDGAVLTVTEASAPAGQGSVSVVGNQVRFDPGADFDYLAVGESEEVVVSYTISDEHGAESTSSLTITVTGTNDGPTLEQAIDDQHTDEDAEYSFDTSAHFDDVDATDSLTYTAELSNGDPLPLWLSIDATTGVLSGTPANGDVGEYLVVVTATDESLASVSDTFELTVDNVNDVPVVTAEIADQSTDEEMAYSYDASANFADDDTIHGDTHEYSASGLPSWLSIDAATGLLSGTPDNDDIGGYTITVTATDDAGETASSTFELTVDNVNDVPVATVEIADQSTDEDVAYSYDASANFADDDTIHGDTLAYSASGLPTWLSIDAATGLLSGTPDNDDVDSYTITVTATDDAGTTASSTFELTVDNVNDAPALTETQFVFADGTEDTEYTVTKAELLQGFTDVDDDTLSVSALTAMNGTVIDNGDGTYTVTPAANFAGTVTLNYNVIDGNGGSLAASNGVFFESINDPATFSGTFSGTVVEATSSNPGTPSVAGSVTFQDVDELNPFFQQVTVPQASTGGYGSFTLSQTGTWVYTLNNGHPMVDALNNGGTLNDSFVIHSADGTEQVISITINGTTDFTYVSPNVFTGTGDPNDFDALGNPLGQTLPGGNGNDTIYGGAGADTINGGNGDDIIYGGSGGDNLDGGTQGDHLYGGSGNDTITGGNQNDRLIGGYGADTLDGGNGSDTFVYLSSLDTGDTINGFVAGADDIDLTAFAPTSFVGAITQAGAVGANEVGYMVAGGITTVYVDTDGAFGADLEIKLTGNIPLSVNDFILTP